MWESAWQQRSLGNPWRQNLLTLVETCVYSFKIFLSFWLAGTPWLLFKCWCWESPYLKKSGEILLVESGIRNPESGKFLFVESRINKGIGSRNTARGIRNPLSLSTNLWNPESKFYWERPAESTACNREFNTVFDSATWGIEKMNQTGRCFPIS